jgi:CIC family chloride channel protein
MVVAIVALMTSRRWSIYTNQVDNKFSSKAHLWEMNPNVLKRVTISDAMRGIYDRRAIVSHDLTFAQVEAFAKDSGENDLVLVNERGELAGLLALKDLGHREEVESLGTLVLADDLVNRRSVVLHPDDNLIRALEFFGEGDFDKLPIVERGEPGRLLGYVRYRDIIAFYQREHGTSAVQPVGLPLGS